MDCRGLALLSIRELTGKTAGDFTCDRLGICDANKDIPSTGSDGLAKNYFPALGTSVYFLYTEDSAPIEGGLTFYDWHGDGTYDHTNIITNVDIYGYRTWVYSNADCSSDNHHLRMVSERDLTFLKDRILNNHLIGAEEYPNVLKLTLLKLSQEEATRVRNFVEQNREAFLTAGFLDSSIDEFLNSILLVRSINRAWSQEVLY